MPRKERTGEMISFEAPQGSKERIRLALDRSEFASDLLRLALQRELATQKRRRLRRRNLRQVKDRVHNV